MKYIVKNESGTFDMNTQPEGFRAIIALENRLFVCDSPTVPVSDFVVEFPDDRYAQFLYYSLPDGKKILADIFGGLVKFGDEVDSKGRRIIVYTQEQKDTRLDIIKWIILNVFIPDKARMYSISDDIVASYIASVNALETDALAVTYVQKNLYYNL